MRWTGWIDPEFQNRPSVCHHGISLTLSLRSQLGLGPMGATTPCKLIVRSTLSKRRHPRQPATTSDLLRVIPSTSLPRPLPQRKAVNMPSEQGHRRECALKNSRDLFALNSFPQRSTGAHPDGIHKPKKEF